MKIQKSRLFCGLVAMALSVATASATIWNLQSSLDPLQDGGGARTGIGFATLTLDDVTGTITITSGTFSGLSGTTTAAHIHGYSGPGVNSGIVVPLTIDLGVSSGVFSGSGTIDAANVLAGLTYVNIHTSPTFGGGEIRGQITVVPEPSTYALLGLGAAGLFAIIRRRKAITS